MTKGPSESEEEYFARIEFERRKTWENERASKMAVAEKDKLRELHLMKCPKCGMDLHTFELKGVKLDRCVSCHGTWFDAGEIEQVMGQEDKSVLGKMLTMFK